MKPKGRKPEAPNRDRKGRFLAEGKKDPCYEVADRLSAEEDKLAETYIKICGAIGHPRMLRLIGIKRDTWPGRRNSWKIGREATPFFAGLLCGIFFMMRRGQKKDHGQAIVSFMEEAKAISKNVTRFERELDAFRLA